MDASQRQYRLPSGAHIGGIQIRVSDLERAVRFYGDLVGFRLLENSNGTAKLTGHVSHEASLTLRESRAARPRGGRSAGLFHVAFRYSGRKDLAAALWRFLKHRYPLDGAADHKVSDAIYLEDPDGNGVELYCDHPQTAWPRHGDELVMTTEPLDVRALLQEVPEPSRGEDVGVKGRVEIGHVHLQVTDLAAAEQFYRGVLGFDVTQRTFPGALFLSAGGYHHHVGLNTWSTRGGVPADQDSLGMISFDIRTGDATALETLRTGMTEPLGVAVAAPFPSSPGFLHVFDPDHIGITIAV